MKFLRAFLFLCCLIAPVFSLWASPITLDDHPGGFTLSDTDHIQWLADPPGHLTLEDVRSGPWAERFETPQTPQRGTEGVAHWIKVELQQRGQGGDWVLATQTTALKEVHFYGPFGANGQALAPPVVSGLTEPFSTRPLASERYVMRLQLAEPGTYTVYARLVSDTGSTLQLSVWETAEFLQWRQHKRLFDGLGYGFLLALLVYNLALAVIFRDSSYGYYIGQCACALLTLACFNGHASHYLWGNWPWWQERAYVVLPALWLAMGGMFARSFLELKRVRALDRALLAMVVVALATAAMGLAGQFRWAQASIEVTATVLTVLGVGSALVMVRRGFTPARWYLNGQLMLFISVLAVVLVNWKVIDSPFLLANGLQIGVAAEMVVFAIALGSRISRLRASQTALRLHAAHLAQVAATDPLTGLANRNGLTQGAEAILAGEAQRALMLLDLDQFKPINDLHGHDAGDVLLRAIAQRLRANVRSDDVVARLGGDEFVVLLARPTSDQELSALTQRLIHAVTQPVDVQNTRLSVGVSVGVARAPGDGHTLEELMRNADQAMYIAKQAHAGYAFWKEGSAPPDSSEKHPRGDTDVSPAQR
jgi:diguanylate cyclase (GGDEF)-like protein